MERSTYKLIEQTNELSEGAKEFDSLGNIHFLFLTKVIVNVQLEHVFSQSFFQDHPKPGMSLASPSSNVSTESDDMDLNDHENIVLSESATTTIQGTKSSTTSV